MSEYENGQLIGNFPIIPKQERAQQKRNALLKSGRTLFIEQGYDLTTAKEIAAHAGVATGTFYRYFSDKRQLLMSLLEDQIEMLLPPEPNWIHNNPEHYLAVLLEEYYNRLHELGLYRVIPELLHCDSELAEVMLEAKRKIYKRIHTSLVHAKEKGFMWVDLDIDTVSWAVMILVEKGFTKEADTGIKTNYIEMAKMICRIVLPPNVTENLRKRKTYKP